MSTVITMTSYPKRINEVAKFIYKFMNTQIKKPDYFYLWLSTVEFPNKENDLPNELLLVAEAYDIKISWVEYNDGCMKRWNVYPKHFNDTVAAIDEDNFYDIHLVEKMETIKEKTGCVYAIFDKLTNYLVLDSHSINFKYLHYKKLNLPATSIKIKLSGNSVVPPNTFPLDALDKKYLPLRLKYCKRCDESWLQPFYRCNGIQSTSFGLDKLNPDDLMEKTGMNKSGKIINGVWWKNLQIYIVLRLFPDKMKKWKTLFPLYDDKEFSNYSVDELCSLLDMK